MKFFFSHYSILRAIFDLDCYSTPNTKDLQIFQMFSCQACQKKPTESLNYLNCFIPFSEKACLDTYLAETVLQRAMIASPYGTINRQHYHDV